ncbi:MAG: methyltransferase domain-containing protein [Candidatus Dormibacteria bacterium]
MFSPKRHRQLARLLDIGSTSRILDLGCGPGRTMEEIAHILGPGGSITGVDLKEMTFPDQLAGDARVRQVVADVAGPLPFEDGAFDRVVSHNVLELLSDPGPFLLEAWRVLVSDGILVLGHTDFDTMVFASDDLPLTRQLVHCFCDTTQGWMQRSDGTMGRKLAGIVAGSSFRTERVTGWINLLTSFAPGSPGRNAAEAVASVGRHNPDIDNRSIDEWFAGLERLAERDAFLYSVNDYAIVARKA